VVQIRGFKHEDSAQLLFRLGIGAIEHLRFAARDAYGYRRRTRLETFGAREGSRLRQSTLNVLQSLNRLRINVSYANNLSVCPGGRSVTITWQMVRYGQSAPTPMLSLASPVGKLTKERRVYGLVDSGKAFARLPIVQS